MEGRRELGGAQGLLAYRLGSARDHVRGRGPANLYQVALQEVVGARAGERGPPSAIVNSPLLLAVPETTMRWPDMKPSAMKLPAEGDERLADTRAACRSAHTFAGWEVRAAEEFLERHQPAPKRTISRHHPTHTI